MACKDRNSGWSVHALGKICWPSYSGLGQNECRPAKRYMFLTDLGFQHWTFEIVLVVVMEELPERTNVLVHMKDVIFYQQICLWLRIPESIAFTSLVSCKDSLVSRPQCTFLIFKYRLLSAFLLFYGAIILCSLWDSGKLNFKKMKSSNDSLTLIKGSKNWLTFGWGTRVQWLLKRALEVQKF